MRVLFVCIHNSARSQMAEAFLNHLGGGRFVAESAGIEAGKLNFRAVRVMREIGVDMAHHATKCVSDCLHPDKQFDMVITVCDAANAEKCPVVPGATTEAWCFDDPSAFTGSDEEMLARTRVVRDQIRAKVEEFIGRQTPQGATA